MPRQLFAPADVPSSMPASHPPAPLARAAVFRATFTTKFIAGLMIVIVSALACRSALASDLSQKLAKLAPQADPKVISLAVEAMTCAEKHGQPQATRLAVVDYAMPSTARRLWVFDVATPKLLFHERVTHGSATGGNKAVFFSNKPGSHASSLGLFLTGKAYYGNDGYSMRLKGLEPGINNNAYRRAIVMHGASYATSAFVEKYGRLGRSWGCLAVAPKNVKPLINALKDDQYIFSYYPKPSWIEHSRFLHCSAHS